MVVSKPSSCFGTSHHSVISYIEEHNANDSLIKVPENYIIPYQEASISDGTIFATIPTIDMKELVLINHEELKKLHSTCKEWGIFQLVNHGVNSSLLNKLKQEIEEFFKLPLEEKMRYKVRPSDFEGYGTVVKSQDQKLDWGNRFYVITNPINTRKPYLLPELPTSLRNTLETYLLELQRIAKTLLGLIGKLLKMNKEEMEQLFEDGMQSVRITHYPPCPKPELVVGLRPHSDGSGITILHQVNGVQGLQIKKDGVWFPVNFDNDAFVVNVGDILESFDLSRQIRSFKMDLMAEIKIVHHKKILSDGIYKSIEHRATVNSEKERISIAMFFTPKLEAEIGPMTALRDPTKPPFPSFMKIGMKKFVEDFFAHNLDGKSHLERMRIKNSEEHTTT